MLAAADRITRGELPWSDFWWVYGPAEPLGLAGLQELVGPSLLAWRVVHVLVAAGAALLAYRLVRREAPLPAALAAWLTVTCALSFPLIPNPVAPALLLALGALAAAPRRPLLAGVLAGAAVAFRLDVGTAAVVAAVIAAGPRPAALRALAAAAVTALVAVGPFAVAAGLGTFLDQTIGFALDEQSMQRLPLPLDGGGTSDLNKAFEHLFPTLALVAFALWVGAAVWRWAAGGRGPSRLELAALPLALAGALYLVARADEFHVVLLQATVPLLAAPALAAARRERMTGPAVLAALALALPLLYGIDRKGVQLIHPPDLAPLDVDVADGVRADPAEARSLERLVRYVDRRTDSDDPVFVANPRHDLVRVGNPLVSVLVQRANPTRYPIMQPGVITEAGVQREIVHDLERTHTPLVVRWLSPVAAERRAERVGRVERGAAARPLPRAHLPAHAPLRRLPDPRALTHFGRWRSESSSRSWRCSRRPGWPCPTATRVSRSAASSCRASRRSSVTRRPCARRTTSWTALAFSTPTGRSATTARW